MRAFRVAAGAAIAVLTLIGSTAPGWGLAPSPTQTVTKMVTALCTTSLETFDGAPVDVPPPAPFSTTVPVTLTVPLRVATGKAFRAQITVGSGPTNALASAVDLSAAPGITPALQRLTIFSGAPLSGSLPFTATGRAGTVSNWRANDFGILDIFFTDEFPEPLLASVVCAPTTQTVLASTRIIGQGPPTG